MLHHTCYTDLDTDYSTVAVGQSHCELKLLKAVFFFLNSFCTHCTRINISLLVSRLSHSEPESPSAPVSALRDGALAATYPTGTTQISGCCWSSTDSYTTGYSTEAEIHTLGGSLAGWAGRLTWHAHVDPWHRSVTEQRSRIKEACGEQVFSPATCTCKSITTESEYVPQGGNWRTAAAERERGALKLLVTSLCFWASLPVFLDVVGPEVSLNNCDASFCSPARLWGPAYVLCPGSQVRLCHRKCSLRGLPNPARHLDRPPSSDT